MLELATAVIRATGSASSIEFQPLPLDDPRQRQPDITKAKEVLGWTPTIDLIQGLERTISYFETELATTGR
jgi:UDP-glucuronate decarboxylase